jgi:predicted dehydrogenase
VKRLRMGIAGAGGQGKKHLANCLRLKNTEVAAVADRSQSIISDISRLGIKTYLDYREMIRKEKLDAVIISLPNYLHEDCAFASSEAGCDILIEKPLARSTDEAEHIANHVRKAGVKLMVGMCHRFIPDCKRLKEAIDAETLGRIDFASALFFAGPFTSGRVVPEWLFEPDKSGGGALLDSGCHLIDLLLWFFGDVHAVAGHTESLFHLGYDDYAEVLMRFKNGVNAVVVTSWRSRLPCYRIEVAGEYGRRMAFSEKFGIFDIGLRRGLLSFLSESISQRLRGRPFLPLGDDIYYNELDYFVTCILNDEEPEPGVDEWLKVSEVIELAYRNQEMDEKIAFMQEKEENYEELACSDFR